MIATPVLDPFETESTLAQEPRVLSFSPRAFEIPMEELLRHLAFDLAGAIPRPLGDVKEALSHPRSGPSQYAACYYHLGQAVLALTTEIRQPHAEHRVLELLGMGEDLRVRINLTRLIDPDDSWAPAVLEAAREGRAVGQARIWGSNPSQCTEVRHTIAKQMRLAGIDSIVLGRDALEPTYRPPAAGRQVLEALPEQDLRVADVLIGLLGQLPVEDALRRAPRRMGEHHERIRRGNSIVSFHYEIHRAASGILHMRRREVEAGIERPGLVRTFNVAGLRGGARLRIRDIGGRATAEFAGSQDTVNAIRKRLSESMGGRA